MVNPDRSYIICHMMTTLDGKIASGIKGVNIFDDYYPLYSKLEHTFKPQAWMCGRVTSEEFAAGVSTPLPPTTATVDSEDFHSSEPGSNYMIAIDTKGQLRWKNNALVFGDQSKHQLIVVVNQTTPKEYLAYLKDLNISFIFAGTDNVDFKLLFQKCKKDFGIDTLALEGGGVT